MASSLETRGQIVGARESLNRRKNMARRKEKDGKKSPWGQCLTRPVPNGRCHSGFWLVPENFCVFLPNQKAERWWPFGTGLVRHCPQGLFSPFFTFLPAIFCARLDFPSPTLSAPGSPRMDYSTYKSFDFSTKVIPSLHVISLAVRDLQLVPAKFKIT